jgi:hypothetical protein
VFGVAGLAVAIVAALAYVRGRRVTTTTIGRGPVPVTLGRRPDA